MKKIIGNYKFGFQKNLADIVQRWMCRKRGYIANIKMKVENLFINYVLSHSNKM